LGKTVEKVNEQIMKILTLLSPLYRWGKSSPREFTWWKSVGCGFESSDIDNRSQMYMIIHVYMIILLFCNNVIKLTWNYYISMPIKLIHYIEYIVVCKIVILNTHK
jgi:hypothetical protein